jgi:MSHA biogenesis protein MshN
MSLINQMLTDLEARRGGKLHQVDQALNGLRSAAEAPRQRTIPRFLGVGALLLITALGGWLLHQVLNRTVPAAPEPLAVVPPQAPPLARDPAVAAPPATALSLPVILADALPPAAAVPPAATQAVPLGAAVAVPQAAPQETPPVVPPGAAVAVTQAVPSAVVLGGAVAVPQEITPAVPLGAAVLSDSGPVFDDAVSPPVDAAPRRLAQNDVENAADSTIEYPGEFHRAPAVKNLDVQADALRLALQSAAAGSTGPLRTFVANYPTRVDARVRLALILLAADQTAEAQASLRAGLNLAPNQTDLAQVLGHSLLEQDQAQAALAVLRPAVPPLTKNPEFHALLAAVEQRLGLHALAVTRYRGLLQRQPDNGNWLVGLGISLNAQGNTQAAVESFTRAADDRTLAEPLRAFAAQERVRLLAGLP